MGSLSQASAIERRGIAETWIAAFNAALDGKDYHGVCQLIAADGYWRDLLTIGWDFRTCQGADAIQAWLATHHPASGACGFAVETDPTIAQIGDCGQTVEFFITFQTNVASGRGYVRLLADPNRPDRFMAFTLLTAMLDLNDFPERIRRQRPREPASVPVRGLQNWLDRRIAAREFSDADPQVIIVGAGMAGLMLAARLGQLDISTLIVDRTDRVGDIWRKRYHSLMLHNEICTNHFPYLSFPDTWPVYIPKDKLANWFEFYAEAMELNIWTQANFLGGTYDDANRKWTVQVRRADGGTRTMRPSHVVMAMGVSGLANIPDLPGRNSFAGVAMHSSGPTDDLDVHGKSALVVGAGTSGHDIAQDLYLRGADVTMLQRSSTCVVSLEPSSIRVFELFKRNEGIRPLVDIDLMAAAIPFDLVRRLQGPMSRLMAEDDRALLDGLRDIGFQLDNGEDDTGYFLKLLRYQGGYYLNVGASDLLIQKEIKLKSAVEITRLAGEHVHFSDGAVMKADILVLATGYQPLQEAIRALFGDEIAERVGPVWGLGEAGELRNMFARTRQDGLHVVGGGFMGCRSYSHYTARLIKADIEGLIPRDLPVAADVALR